MSAAPGASRPGPPTWPEATDHDRANLPPGVSEPPSPGDGGGSRQSIADDQSQPEKHRQPGIPQIAFHPLRQVEEAILKHVGGAMRPWTRGSMRSSSIRRSRSRCSWNGSASPPRSPARSRSSRWMVPLGWVVRGCSHTNNSRGRRFSGQKKTDFLKITHKVRENQPESPVDVPNLASNGPSEIISADWVAPLTSSSFSQIHRHDARPRPGLIVTVDTLIEEGRARDEFG